ncbi:MAG: hypothetical protein ACE5IW_03415 [bacterium]
MEFKAKRRFFGAFCILGVMLTLSIIIYSCSDLGVDADFFCCGVTGEIIIDTIVPMNTDEIRIAVTKQFPPLDFEGIVISSPLDVKVDSNVTSQRVPFEVLVPEGEYEAVFVIWKEKDKSVNPADRIGLYGNLQLEDPIPITVSAEDSTVENIEIDIDFTKVLRTSIIEGRITFVNNGIPATAEQWPPNTGFVAIFAFPIVPEVFPEDFLTFSAFEILPQNVEQLDYRLRISAGVFKYIAVFWLAEGALLEDFKDLGFYRDPLSDEPGEVSVGENETVTGIDITAEFANIND